MKTLQRNKFKGFTLIELMIVVMIVAILLAIAYPSYVKYVRKAKRGDAQQLLMNWSINQEIWRSNHTAYASDAELTPPASDHYGFVGTDIFATTYTLTATAPVDDDQRNDKSRDNSVDCFALTLNQSGVKGPADCWE